MKKNERTTLGPTWTLLNFGGDLDHGLERKSIKDPDSLTSYSAVIKNHISFGRGMTSLSVLVWFKIVL